MALSVGQQPDHLAQRGFVPQLVGPDLQAAELVDRAGKDGVALALVDRHAFAGEHGLIDGGPPASTIPSTVIRSPGRTTTRSPITS